MNQQNQSPLETHRKTVEEWVEDGLSNAEIIDNLAALKIPTSERSVRRALRRWEVERPIGEDPSFKLDGDVAEIVGAPAHKLNTPEDLMIERGLDPEEWEIVSMTINEWHGPTKAGGGRKVTGRQDLKQLKIHLRRKKPITLIAPARVDGPVYKAVVSRVAKKDGPKRVVFVGDQQAPYHHTHLHEVFCQFLKFYEPDEGVLIGDTVDFPDISRHPANPERDVTPQDCIDAGYLVLRDYREAYVAASWRKLAGNHDERLRRYQVDRVRELYGIRRAAVPDRVPESPVMEVPHLLRLDELEIEYVAPDGDYEHTQINVSAHLAARHGWIARKGSGASALATLEHLGFSVIVGHTHRQSLVHKTRHDINGELTTLAACETGCMCRIEEGLGYTVAPDWQNGFATAEVWPDGTFKIDVATYVNGTLYYRDRRFS